MARRDRLSNSGVRIGILKGVFGAKHRPYSLTCVDYEFEREHTGAFWAGRKVLKNRRRPAAAGCDLIKEGLQVVRVIGSPRSADVDEI